MPSSLQIHSILVFRYGEKRREAPEYSWPTSSANLQPTLLFSRSLDFIRLANHNLPRSIQSRRCSINLARDYFSSAILDDANPARNAILPSWPDHSRSPASDDPPPRQRSI